MVRHSPGLPDYLSQDWPNMSTQQEREAEIAALIARAQDPDDAYDGHHGTDRSEDSLEYARIHDPELAKRIEDKILTNASE